MSSSYTPTAEFTDSTTVLADGDAANATNLNAAPKKALDRAAYLRDATDGLLVWGGNARVASGGTNNGNFKVYCPPIEAVSLLNGTTWGAYSLATETEITSAANFASGTLANSTPYYVYAKVTSSALAIEVSATAPDSGSIWKSGATGTHRYLFSFVTDSPSATAQRRASPTSTARRSSPPTRASRRSRASASTRARRRTARRSSAPTARRAGTSSRAWAWPTPRTTSAGR